MRGGHAPPWCSDQQPRGGTMFFGIVPKEACGMPRTAPPLRRWQAAAAPHRRSARNRAGVDRLTRSSVATGREHRGHRQLRVRQFSEQVASDRVTQAAARINGAAAAPSGEASAGGTFAHPQRDQLCCTTESWLVSLHQSALSPTNSRKPTAWKTILQPLGRGRTAHPLNQQQQETDRHSSRGRRAGIESRPVDSRSGL